MNEENIKVFIDFGSSKIRLGVFSKEISKNIIILEEDCISNFSLKKLDINNSQEVIKNLIKSAEKKINKHIKNINLMIDTPDIFSLDFSIKNNFDKKSYSKNDIYSLINEAKKSSGFQGHLSRRTLANIFLLDSPRAELSHLPLISSGPIVSIPPG